MSHQARAAIAGIEYHLPEKTTRTEDLSAEFPEWSVEKIDSRTGIRERHIAAADECASDLAVAAAHKLFTSGLCAPQEIDFILHCTQTPDYLLPTTACLIQDRLCIPTTAGALDFNLGSSGYVYGLGLAEGLIATGQASRILLLTADTYSKLVNPRDRSVRTIFGDAAAATLVVAEAAQPPRIGPFVYGTDGHGGPNLIVPSGGMRQRYGNAVASSGAEATRTDQDLFMDGGEIFNFTLDVVPPLVNGLLEKAGLDLSQIDLFVFHQANKFMLDHLRKRMKIPEDRFQLTIAHCGNTVSCTIPIALKTAADEGKLRNDSLVMLVGFGVGYSWGATLVRWRQLA